MDDVSVVIMTPLFTAAVSPEVVTQLASRKNFLFTWEHAPHDIGTSHN